MYLKILRNKNISFKTRLTNFFEYARRKRGVQKGWAKRFNKIIQIHPDYFNPIESSIEKEHKLFWSSFSKKANLSTIRVGYHISGVAKKEIIPEEIFALDIEPTLNNKKEVKFLSNKSLYNFWNKDSFFPNDYFHKINGEYLDKNLSSIKIDDVFEILNRIDYPAVLKPNIDSYGGKNILFPKNLNELKGYVLSMDDFVVQEKIKQNDFFERIYSESLNTIRVVIYKSVKNNQLVFLNAALRLGKGGSLDNETAGGIVVALDEKGVMGGFAKDKFGTKYFTHPDTGYAFSGKIPRFEELKEISIKVAQKMFYSRIIGLDFCLDNQNSWRIIEIGFFGHTIRFSQYGGNPFFGKFTDEVIEYCQKNHWALK